MVPTARVKIWTASLLQSVLTTRYQLPFSNDEFGTFKPVNFYLQMSSSDAKTSTKSNFFSICNLVNGIGTKSGREDEEGEEGEVKQVAEEEEEEEDNSERVKNEKEEGEQNNRQGKNSGEAFGETVFVGLSLVSCLLCLAISFGEVWTVGRCLLCVILGCFQ